MQVFISHSSNDKDLVRRIADVLKESGMDVWDDTREILPGDNWAEKIAKALEESQAMVVLLTPDTLNSKWMSWDIQYALGQMAYNKRIIPVLIGDPEDVPKQDIPWILRHLKMVYLPEQGKNKASIKQIAEAIKEAA
jgi:hypothetical protein